MVTWEAPFPYTMMEIATTINEENEAVDVDATEETEAVEQGTEVDEQEEIIRIEYNGNIYDIPATVLEQYKVEK